MLSLLTACLVSPGEYRLLLEDAQDADNDGEISAAYGGPDCDDTLHHIHSQAEELCDQVDNDCDGSIDEGLPTEVWYLDADRDGYGDPARALDRCSPPDEHVLEPGDCDDTEDDVNPSVPEVCDDGVDNNCDGAAPECVLEGQYELDKAASLVVKGQPGEVLGISLLVADFDQDGDQTLVVGAPFHSAGAAQELGAAHIFDPFPAGNVDTTQADLTILGEEKDLFGGSLEAADLDDDGYPDLAIGNVGQSSVFIWSGAIPTAEWDAPGTRLQSTQSGDNFGATLASVPLDGEAHLVVGAPDFDEGAVFLFSFADEKDQSTDEAAVTFVGDGVGNLRSIGVGDTNGDGQQDLSLGSSSRGTVWLFTHVAAGGTLPTDEAAAEFLGLDSGFGSSALLWDQNGDGYADQLIASPYEGRVYVLHGGPEVLESGLAKETASVVLEGGEFFGLVLESSGSNLFVSTPEYEFEQWFGGRVDVFSPDSSPTPTPWLTVSGQGRLCGWASTMTDVNQDDELDFLTTCPGQEDTGYAHILLAPTP